MRREKKQSGSQSSDPIITKSCQNNLGEDPIQSSSMEYQQVPRPKSFRGLDEESSFQDLTSAQKKMVNDAIKKDLKMAEKGKNEQKNKLIGQNRTDKHFADQIQSSVELSIADSSRKEEDQINNRQNQSKKKKSYFNLILLGAASTGKTTFMECFLKQYKQKNQQFAIKQHTQKITEVKSQAMSSNLSLQFYVIDTPGFTHSSINNYSQQIQEQIRKRMENTRKNRKKAMTVSAVYSRQERQIRDQRIHCCLFFFRGPRMHSDDWKLMQLLHDKCNIIPVIAKGDSYTIQQVQELKKNIRAKGKEKDIKWFDIQEYIRQKYPQQLNSIINGPYGPSPPFMIASSISINVDVKLGREYKWGTCLIHNQNHTEFKILEKILTKYLTQGFVKMIDVMQDSQKARLQSQNKINSIKVITTFGIFMGIILLGNKLIKNHSLKID